MADSFTAAQKLTAAFLNALFKGSAGWEPYTPAFGPGVIGNGSLAGAYARVGRSVLFRVHMIWGSTTTNGAGAFTYTLPTTPTNLGTVGTARILDASPAVQYYRHAFANGGNVIALAAEAASTFVQGTVPITFTTGDQLFINGTYESST